MIRFVVFCVLALPAAAMAAQPGPLCRRADQAAPESAALKTKVEQNAAFVISIDGVKLPDEATGLPVAAAGQGDGSCPATS